MNVRVREGGKRKEEGEGGGCVATSYPQEPQCGGKRQEILRKYVARDMFLPGTTGMFVFYQCFLLYKGERLEKEAE